MVRTFHGLSVFNHNQWVRFCVLLSGTYLSTVIISKGFSSSRNGSVNVIERLVELLHFIADPRRLWLPGSEQLRRYILQGIALRPCDCLSKGD